MSTTRKLIIGAISLGVLAIGAALFVFFVVLEDAPPPVAIEDAVAQATSTSIPASTDSVADPVSTEVTGTQPSIGAGLDGTWTVDASLDSFIGYRVQEELSGIGSQIAAGRTATVTGSLVIEGTTITSVQIEADVSDLDSGQSFRDNAIRTRGLESDSFPTATFALTDPIELTSVPAEGEAVGTAAIGDLTAHGVTRPVELVIDAQLTGGIIAVVGSTDVTLDEFEIEGLEGLRVLSVSNEAVIEFQLFFQRS
ncbi:MAG: YceI family protein [Acidimicrobiia bacterium]|nr:YceI family protein [Acidimicrobiia bacterium]